MEKIEDSYELGEVLGNVVVKGTSKLNGKDYAVKIIDKSELGKEFEKNLTTEIDILKQVDHPGIIKLHEVKHGKDKLYLIMELVTGGELFDRIVAKESYSEADAAQVVYRIVSAIQYLHSLGIVHRDLKPENLLLKSTTSDLEIVGTEQMMQTACGTPSYVAPEVLAATGYGPEVDMWSVGVITYILLCGFPPFYGDSISEIFEQILDVDYDFPEEYWADVSPEAIAFITSCLTADIEARLTPSQGLLHPWLKAQARRALPSAALRKKLEAYLLERETDKV